MQTPFFSIVLPTYDRARLLDRALESVLAQRETCWELLIADDGSTDGTWASLCDWTRRDDRIRCWRHSNRGQAASRNQLLPHARGQWIVFLDSDDEFLPDHLLLRRQAIATEAQVDLWISPMSIVGSPLVPCRTHPGQMIHIDRCVGVGMLTVHKAALLQAGGFPELAYAEDSALMTRLLAAGIRSQRLPHRSYVYHRDHSDSLTKNRQRLHLQQSLSASTEDGPCADPAASRFAVSTQRSDSLADLLQPLAGQRPTVSP